MCRASDIRQKEIINITDGRRLGFVGDVEINFEEGKIESIIVPTGGRWFGLIGRDSEIVIPWDRVRRIGEDIILVEVDERFMRKYYE